VNDERAARENVRLGLALFIVAVIIMAATVGFAYLYLALS